MFPFGMSGMLTTAGQNMTSEGMILSILGGFSAFIFTFLLILILIFITFYIWRSLAWMTISKKLRRGIPWFAWIPLLNTILVWQMSATPLSLLIAYFLLGGIATITVFFFLVVNSMLSPFILAALLFFIILLALAVFIIQIYWWWRISEARGYPGWIYLFLSLLIFIPYIGTLSTLGKYIFWSFLAWYDPTTPSQKKNSLDRHSQKEGLKQTKKRRRRNSSHTTTV